jgi:hypothetical protein
MPTFLHTSQWAAKEKYYSLLTGGATNVVSLDQLKFNCKPSISAFSGSFRSALAKKLHAELGGVGASSAGFNSSGAAFSEEEMHAVIRDIEGDKAQGLMGISASSSNSIGRLSKAMC